MQRTLRHCIAVAAALALLPIGVSAQRPSSVRGQVTGADTGQPLAGVQVSLKGTPVGTLTNAAGEYAFTEVPANADTIVFSSIGYQTQELPLNQAVINVALKTEAVKLEGVVVTAIGIQRKQRSLGYSVQEVSGDRLAEVPQPNLVSSLSGRMSGVNITTAGPPGGTTRIIIRGSNSLTGDNQPLFIVDGVAVDNSAPSNNGYGGIDYGNAAADIDPDQIESISVLKGPNAAALYGSRAANGAVIITTKSGQNAVGGQITASTAVTFDTPLRLPEYQNVYGQGSTLYGCPDSGFPTGPGNPADGAGCFSYVDGNGGGLFDYYDESWGPPMDGRLIRQWFSPDPQPWTPQPNNVRDVFNTGRTWDTNLSFSTASDAGHVRLAATQQLVEGMYPGNQLRTINASLNGGIDLSAKLNASASIMYVTKNGFDRPGTGYDAGNIMEDFVWYGRQLNTQRLAQNYMCDSLEEVDFNGCTLGGQVTWSHIFHNNPFFTAHVDTNSDSRDRVIGHIQVGYKLTDWLDAMVRTGTDYYQDTRERDFAVTDNNNPDGAFFQNLISRQQTNTDFLLTANRNVTPDLNIVANVGGNSAYRRDNLHDINVNKLAVPGIYSLQNAGQTPTDFNHLYRSKVNSLYGSAQFNYRDFLSLDLTGRNDWSSTLPDQNNSYFYPSASVSFVFTNALGIHSETLPFGKLRASWARVGADADPYQLINTYSKQDPWGGLATFSVPNSLANAQLKPEQTESWEVGTELNLFNGQAGLIATYYHKNTKNQILPAQVSTTSGYSSRYLNAGEIENKGFELQLNLAPITTSSGFRWDMNMNFGKNDNEVVALAEGLQSLVLGTYWYMNIEARPGEPYGQLVGYKWQRVPDGPLAGELILDGGLPSRDPVKQVMGNYNPDWTAGLRNSFSFKNLQLSFLIDHKQGGQIFSATNWFGDYAGVLSETLRGREVSEIDPGIVVHGATDNGDGTYSEVTDTVVSQDWFENYFYAHEFSVFDATFTKLREATLTYDVPEKLLPLNFSNMSISVIGRNLFLWSKIPHIDPETAFDASNVQGLEFGQFPTTRSIGFRISIRP